MANEIIDIECIKIIDFECFTDTSIDLPNSLPVNLIIGKNNSGKSRYLELIRKTTAENIGDFLYQTVFLKDSRVLLRVRVQFNENGENYTEIVNFSYAKEIELLPVEDVLSLKTGLHRDGEIFTCFTDEETNLLNISDIHKLLLKTKVVNSDKQFRCLSAERDILIDSRGEVTDISSNGINAVKFVSSYLDKEINKRHAHLIDEELIYQLNKILDTKDPFTNIGIKESKHGQIHIYLKKRNREWYSLEESGSGLKTIILVLLNIILIPVAQNKYQKDYIFAFEELENNLHPSALRKLLEFIEHQASPEGPHFFLSTHSSVALDFFSQSDKAQIIHIWQTPESSFVKNVAMNSEQLHIIRDLGSRASDLLQANGIIWVEGPSDRIYLNKWIELWSEGNFKEGRHYQIMFYGGSVLSNFEALEDDTTAENVKDLVNLIKVNPNAVLVSDSDRSSQSAELKPRVQRINEEFSKLSDHCWHWVMEAKESENYLTGDLINAALKKVIEGLESPTKYEPFFPREKDGGESYLKAKVNHVSFASNKNSLARMTSEAMTKDELKNRFDLDMSMQKIVGLIKQWND